jgi:hypothetical protein
MVIAFRIAALANRIKKLLHRLAAADNGRPWPVPALGRWHPFNVVAIFWPQCYVSSNAPNDGRDGRPF